MHSNETSVLRIQKRPTPITDLSSTEALFERLQTMPDDNNILKVLLKLRHILDLFCVFSYLIDA